MGVWTYLSSSRTTILQSSSSNSGGRRQSTDIVISTTASSVKDPLPASGGVQTGTELASHTVETTEVTRALVVDADKGVQHLPQRRRLTSLRHTLLYSRSISEHKEGAGRVSRSELRAHKNALRVQALITGEPTASSPEVTPIIAQARLNKIKHQLSEPKSANKLISELRRLPVQSSDVDAQDAHGDCNRHRGPIHAVCLEHADAEQEFLHLTKLQASPSAAGMLNRLTSPSLVSLSAAPVDKLVDMLNGMQVIDLLSQPDLGIGQPGDGKGLLAGAVPTAETVLNGAKLITPHLMAIGYATGKQFTPDHSDVYPPTDRISVITYWWGLEVLMPPPTLEYLASVQSITSSIVNFLSTMALVNNGVREILPLIRYISQYIDIEYKTIKLQDQGKGVVCAATWLMPAALVPRPWDFPEPKPSLDETPAYIVKEGLMQPEGTGNPQPTSPSRDERPISSILDIVASH